MRAIILKPELVDLPEAMQVYSVADIKAPFAGTEADAPAEPKANRIDYELVHVHNEAFYFTGRALTIFRALKNEYTMAVRTRDQIDHELQSFKRQGFWRRLLFLFRLNELF